jgi:hypothetical protein
MPEEWPDPSDPNDHLAILEVFADSGKTGEHSIAIYYVDKLPVNCATLYSAVRTRLSWDKKYTHVEPAICYRIEMRNVPVPCISALRDAQELLCEMGYSVSQLTIKPQHPLFGSPGMSAWIYDMQWVKPLSGH